MSAKGQDLAAIQHQAREQIDGAESLQALVEVRSRFLGRKGSLSEVLRGLGGLAPGERARVGQGANALKLRIEQWVTERRAALAGRERDRALAGGRLDVTLPGAVGACGHLHPVTRAIRDMVGFFSSLGFSIEEGPEVETEYHNFEALNFPEDHTLMPAMTAD